MFTNFPLFPHQASAQAAQVDNLYFFLLSVTAFFSLLIATLVVVFAIKYRRRHRDEVGVAIHGSLALEMLWTIIPFFILIGMAWPATKTVLALKDSSNPDITIKATGYQWKWGYDYLKGEGEGISLLSNLATPADQVYGRQPKGEHYLPEVDQNLVVPVGKRIRILLTAGDVIHASWVPALGIKQDAIPGLVRDAWFKADKEGLYRGQCAELCGKDRGFMPIVVEVVSPEKYAAWVGDQRKKLAAAAANAWTNKATENLVQPADVTSARNEQRNRMQEHRQ